MGGKIEAHKGKGEIRRECASISAYELGTDRLIHGSPIHIQEAVRQLRRGVLGNRSK